MKPPRLSLAIRICGKPKIVVFPTEADGICRIISNPPPKSIF